MRFDQPQEMVHLKHMPAQLDAIKLVMETQISFTISYLKGLVQLLVFRNIQNLSFASLLTSKGCVEKQTYSTSQPKV